MQSSRDGVVLHATKTSFHLSFFELYEQVDLSHNNLSRLHPETFSGNDKLRFLSLSHNPLRKLEAHQFPPLPHLRMLELVKCDLHMLDKKAFMHLNTLQTLKLSANQFTSLKPDVFQPLNKLKSLDLQVNCFIYLLLIGFFSRSLPSAASIAGSSSEGAFQECLAPLLCARNMMDKRDGRLFIHASFIHGHDR